MKLVISAPLQAQIVAHLEASYPNEGGGFLVGKQEAGQSILSEVRPVANRFATEEQYHRYLMEEGAFLAAEDDADARGLDLLGYFHSHPNAPAVPSDFDRVHALPNFLYLILSVVEGRSAEARVWHLRPDRSGFDPLPLHILTDAPG
ncbi:MAG: M67 family metallopeptidase [Anaerolineae bacterium]|nr:M67 family metallopeptidase [Anaerolineae bacterium]